MKRRVPAAVALLLTATLWGCATGRATPATASVPCTGRVMQILVNQSPNAVEAVERRGEIVTRLAMAPPGLASQPFPPPRFEEAGMSRTRPDPSPRVYRFLRDMSTGMLVPSRDPRVRVENVCTGQAADTTATRP